MICLFIWKLKLREKERDCLSICWFISLMAARTRAAPGQSPSLELHLGLLHGWQGPKHLCQLLLLSQIHEQGAGWEVEYSGLELEPTWDSGITGMAFVLNVLFYLHILPALAWHEAMQISSEVKAEPLSRMHANKGTYTDPWLGIQCTVLADLTHTWVLLRLLRKLNVVNQPLMTRRSLTHLIGVNELCDRDTFPLASSLYLPFITACALRELSKITPRETNL